MYFESDRTAEDGMLAVGTVIANRLASGRYGSTVCEVVAQKLQFAPGVLSRSMSESASAERARRVADAVLAGRRHPTAGAAMYFHTANVPFRHDDKRYLLVSGGNAFYAWNRAKDVAVARANAASLTKALAAAGEHRDAAETVVATLSATSRPETSGAETARPAVAPERRRSALAVVARLDAAGAPRARDDAALLALNYAQEQAPAAEPELASIAAPAEPAQQKGPRVIAPSAPVMAAFGPLFGAAKTVPFEVPASTKSPLANLVVAQSWSAFARR